jgi:3',5'-cyclic AMP phosphodiesterase CpdA
VVVLHHNVLRGSISGRVGLVAARRVHERLRAIGVDLVLTGHDHEEATGTVAGTVAVSAAGTHSSRSRLGRPGVFNTIRLDRNTIAITHYRWEAADRRFAPGQTVRFPRGGVEHVLVETEAGR